jgi:hypothetical protein
MAEPPFTVPTELYWHDNPTASTHISNNTPTHTSILEFSNVFNETTQLRHSCQNHADVARNQRPVGHNIHFCTVSPSASPSCGRGDGCLMAAAPPLQPHRCCCEL